jgi:hypothetical protein
VLCIWVRWLIDDNVFASTMLIYCYVIVSELYGVSGSVAVPCLVLGIIDKLLVRISNNSSYTFCLVPVRCSEKFVYVFNVAVFTVNFT